MTPTTNNGGLHENARGSAANHSQQQQLHTQKPPGLPSSCLDACFGVVLGLRELLLGLRGRVALFTWSCPRACSK